MFDFQQVVDGVLGHVQFGKTDTEMKINGTYSAVTCYGAAD